MKKLFYFLMFLTLGTNCFSQDQEKLPKKPWEDIVEMNSSKDDPITKWGTDIKLKLEGNYTPKDSITVANIIKKLSSLTETISIAFSKSEESNYKIRFSDIIMYEPSGSKNIINYTLYHKNSIGGDYTSGELYVYKLDKTEVEIKKYLESHIASSLVGGRFVFPLLGQKRNSVFNQNTVNVPLNKEDLAIIKEVYKKGFEERLAKAENQFKEGILKKTQAEKISTRDSNLWWVRNPAAVIFLPVLILVLLSLVLINRINKSIGVNIKKDGLRFGVMAAIALLFADIIIIFYVSFYDFLSIPGDYGFALVRKDTIITTLLFSVILFPFLYLYRFIEFKIQKTAKSIFIKTALIFLSTGFLPLVFLLFVNFILTTIIKGQVDYFYLSRIFLYLMVIATIRALIGYFIFKERSLIIENEMKLANLRELKIKAELKSLQSQINPHFLYNSLNSIASLAPIDAQKTQKMAHSLSDLFKYSINRKGKKTNTILDEVNMVKTYLDIEKIRFGERLQFNVTVDKNLENYEIPLFLIQPLVENAVKHGISKNEGEGKIGLKISKEQNEITISVSDNGPDFPEGLLSGHGLQTVFDLLRLTYGDKAALNWTNTPEKMIIITIPETI